MSLYDSKFYYVHKCNTAKKIWDTFEMIYGISLRIEQEKMNTRDEEDDDTTFKHFSKFRNIRSYIGTFITNQYLRVKN